MLYMFHFYIESAVDAEDDSRSRTEAAVEPHHLQPNPSYCSIEMMKKTQHIAYENVIMQ